MDEKQIIVEAWKQTIAVQMHFNDIAIKIRTFALTLIAAILTAQSFANVKIVWLPIAAALGCWLAFYLMDRWWYHYLLLGAVTHGTDLENLSGLLGLEPMLKHVESVTNPLGLSIRITQYNRKGFPYRAQYKMDLYYLLIGSAIFLILPARVEFSWKGWLISIAVVMVLFLWWWMKASRGTPKEPPAPSVANKTEEVRRS
jgi:hypothetical protein